MGDAPPPPARKRPADPWYVRWTLVGATLLIVGLLVAVPLANVFYQAIGKPAVTEAGRLVRAGENQLSAAARGVGHGLATYWHNLTGDPDTRHAVFLTMMVAPVAVGLNLVFGLAAAWLIARFRFPGRTLLTTLIDLPFSVSPVVAGLVFVLIFGVQTPVGEWLRAHGYQVIFAPPGLVLATAFVTFPFVARELIPVLEAVGPEEELAARSLGAGGWDLFWRVTLPNIKWGLLYGVILCNARAMGEFGAVYVVSGRIGGQTDTMPLRVEKLFQEYNQPAAFALASVLTLLALVTLLAKVAIEPKLRQEKPAGPKPGE